MSPKGANNVIQSWSAIATYSKNEHSNEHSLTGMYTPLTSSNHAHPDSWMHDVTSHAFIDLKPLPPSLPDVWRHFPCLMQGPLPSLLPDAWRHFPCLYWTPPLHSRMGDVTSHTFIDLPSSLPDAWRHFQCLPLLPLPPDMWRHFPCLMQGPLPSSLPDGWRHFPCLYWTPSFTPGCMTSPFMPNAGHD